MAKVFTLEELPAVPAHQGNPNGVQADEDVTFKGAVVVRKGEFYNQQYLFAIAAGCETKAATKKQEEK